MDYDTHAKIEKSKESKSGSFANSEARHKIKSTQGFSLIDNRMVRGQLSHKITIPSVSQCKLPDEIKEKYNYWQDVKLKFKPGREHIYKISQWENILLHIRSNEFHGEDEVDIGRYIDEKYPSDIQNIKLQDIDQKPKHEVKEENEKKTEEEGRNEVVEEPRKEINKEVGISDGYLGALAKCKKYDIEKCEDFRVLGKGLNKSAYLICGTNWLILVSAKKYLLEEEVNQLRGLNSSGVDVPSIGKGEVIDVVVNDEKKFGFLEECIDGFEINKKGQTAFGDKDIKEFGYEIEKDILNTNELKNAVKKWKNAMSSIKRLREYIKPDGNDVPDFQVRYEYLSGRIITLDPGQANNSEYNPGKHLRWLSDWEKTITASSIGDRWMRCHPGSNKSEVKDAFQ